MFKVRIEDFPSNHKESFLTGCKSYGIVHSDTPLWVKVYKDEALYDTFLIELQLITSTQFYFARSLLGFTGPDAYFKFVEYEKYLVDELFKMNVIALYLLGRPDTLERESHRLNFVVNISNGISGAKGSMKRDSRYRVNKLQGSLNSTRLIVGPQYIDEFAKYYSILANSIGFSEGYKLSDSCFADLVSSDYIDLCSVVDSGNNWCGGAIVGRNDECVIDYIYSCFSTHLKDSSRLLLMHLYEYFSKCGYSKINLGGGIIENDSLARFKIGMGGIPVNCRQYKIVINSEAYNKMLLSRPLHDSDYFPRFKL